MSFFLFHGKEGDTLLPKSKIYGLKAIEEDTVLLDTDNKVVQCYVCGHPVTKSTALAIGKSIVHRHVKICQALIWRQEHA
jgi:hypothetical protein